ncbi:hypothetical protein N9Q05_01640 [bacterium]|nr:hypothetical protein [bacterium]
MNLNSIEKAKKRIQQMSPDTAQAVIFGLSGNPPTLHHLVFIKHLMRRYSTVHVILNRQSPLKARGDEVDVEIRFEMLQAMMGAEKLDSNHCILERLEMDRAPPSRMIETISALILNAERDSKFTLALGLDCLVDFEKWYKWQHFGDVCDIKFYPRPGMVIPVQQMKNTLKAMVSHHIHVTLVYHSREQKKVYEMILPHTSSRPSAETRGEISLLAEDILMSEGSSTALRYYYSDNNADNSKVPSDIHSVVDAIIRKRGLYGYHQQ